jgi:hypothetical protein
LRVKLAIRPAELAERARGLPPHFVAIWQHLAQLQFAEDPHYAWIRGEIAAAMMGMEGDPLDWLLLRLDWLWSREEVAKEEAEVYAVA